MFIQPLSLKEVNMKKLIVLLGLSLATMPFAYATPQQDKMKSCNAEAKGKKGDERKALMKECLSKDGAAPEKKMTQQAKMKACNKDATGKKGDERKAFMKDCLSK